MQSRVLDGRVDGQMDRRANKFPLYSTKHCPLWGYCRAYFKTSNVDGQGKTADRMLPLGDWLFNISGVIVLLNENVYHLDDVLLT